MEYHDYKDSGIEWIGEIPVLWSTSKIKYLSPVKRGASPRPIDDPKFFDEVGEYSWVRIADVSASNKYLVTTTQKMSKIGSLLSVRLSPGEMFLSIAGTVGKPCITQVKCCIHDGFVYFPKLEQKLKEYLYYIFETGLPYKGLGKLGTQLNLNTETVGDISIPIPKEAEISKIINFIKVNDKHINKLILNYKKQIKTLQQYRQSLITETVTKGLNPDVKMKDSGVEWIGEIPEHWGLTKIKYTTYVKGRIGWQGLRSDEFIDEGPHLVTGTDFENGRISWNKCYHISEKRYKEAPAIQLKESDLLITKDGSIGKLAIVEGKPDQAILNSGIFVTRPLKSDYIPKYLFWMLSSDVFKNYIEYFSSGSTIKHLYQETFVNFSYQFPDLIEQNEIVKYLGKKTSEIDTVIKTIKNQIEILTDYKKSLLYEAVTGKIDVRNYTESDLEVEI
ncbi:restriction endonuclease subunit S [Virgibacillus sp. DJP39]|uniref:restriction endonuclease subunit S n=1 Tax=Virgibacillus sp. DJP39 TaxID=3409790 RepID=UPI003BB574F9